MDVGTRAWRYEIFFLFFSFSPLSLAGGAIMMSMVRIILLELKARTDRAGL